MKLFVLGINHRSAPIEMRETLAVSNVKADQFLSHAVQLPHIEELVALSTCNRVEFYGASRHTSLAKEQLIQFCSNFFKIDPFTFEKHAYFYEAVETIRHGFKVASGLDSMILGEPQILGQMKEAYRQASELGVVDRFLNKFFHRSFHVAKKVRTETSIGAHPVSVSYAAMVLAKQIFGDLKGKKVLVLGAGKMGLLAMRHLKSSGIEKLYIANRTLQHAQEIAEQVGGECIPFENFTKWFLDVDIILTSAAADHYLVGVQEVQNAIRQRKNRPMFFIDIAVPRNVSPEVNQIPNVYLYDVDDLEGVVEVNKFARIQEAERAKGVIEKEVMNFQRELKALEMVPTLSSLAKKFDKICRHELEKLFQKMPELNGDKREMVESMAFAIVHKILHDPMVTLKEGEQVIGQDDFASLVRKLFKLDEA